MVTTRHEACHRIFQDRPELLTPVFRILGVPLPDKASVEVLSPDTTELRPLERRVDTVLRIEPPLGKGDGFLLAIEAQSRRDRVKAVSWAYYLSYLKAKYACPALLLVVCQDTATAKWASGPFHLGPDGWTALSVHPLVLGPGNVPIITSHEQATQDLALATFSAMMHSGDLNATQILKALAPALAAAQEKSGYFLDVLDVVLGDTPKKNIWRSLVRTHFPGRGTLLEETYLEGKAEGLAEGETKGEARSVLRVLANRGVEVSPAARERIISCTDLDTLDRWLDRALTAQKADEIFHEDDVEFGVAEPLAGGSRPHRHGGDR